MYCWWGSLNGFSPLSGGLNFCLHLTKWFSQVWFGQLAWDRFNPHPSHSLPHKDFTIKMEKIALDEKELSNLQLP